MLKYIVTCKEIWNQLIEIGADSREEALGRVANGKGNEVENGFEYNHTMLDTRDW